jgi:hypothetical protein
LCVCTATATAWMSETVYAFTKRSSGRNEDPARGHSSQQKGGSLSSEPDELSWASTERWVRFRNTDICISKDSTKTLLLTPLPGKTGCEPVSWPMPSGRKREPANLVDKLLLPIDATDRTISVSEQPATRGEAPPLIQAGSLGDVSSPTMYW